MVGGPDLPAEAAARLRRIAAELPAVQWVDFDPCMMCRYRQADLVVSMGGYNTMCELAALRRRSLIVPRTQPRREQAIRGALWSQRGAVHVLPREELTQAALARRVEEVLDAPAPTGQDTLDLGGLPRVVERFGEIFASGTIRRGEARHAAAVRL